MKMQGISTVSCYVLCFQKYYELEQKKGLRKKDSNHVLIEVLKFVEVKKKMVRATLPHLDLQYSMCACIQ